MSRSRNRNNYETRLRHSVAEVQVRDDSYASSDEKPSYNSAAQKKAVKEQLSSKPLCRQEYRLQELSTTVGRSNNSDILNK